MISKQYYELYATVFRPGDSLHFSKGTQLWKFRMGLPHPSRPTSIHLPLHCRRAPNLTTNEAPITGEGFCARTFLEEKVTFFHRGQIIGEVAIVRGYGGGIRVSFGFDWHRRSQLVETNALCPQKWNEDD